MDVRTFDWHDWISLYRYRKDVIPLDSATLLTRGHPASPFTWLANLDPSGGSFTGVVQQKGTSPMIGQVRHQQGSRSAHLEFVLAGEPLDKSAFDLLLDESACHAGAWGAGNVVAEVPEDHLLFEFFRKNGYSVYAWQSIWQAPATAADADVSNAPAWQTASSVDETSIRSLYQSLVPPLVQSAEAWSSQRAGGYLYRPEGELMAWCEMRSGTQGIYLVPVVHPGVDDAALILGGLITRLQAALRKPVFVAVRSYQAWLEPALEQLGCTASPRQAMLVRHLTSMQRVPAVNSRYTIVEKKTEPTSPVMGAQMQNGDKESQPALVHSNGVEV